MDSLNTCLCAENVCYGDECPVCHRKNPVGPCPNELPQVYRAGNALTDARIAEAVAFDEVRTRRTTAVDRAIDEVRGYGYTGADFSAALDEELAALCQVCWRGAFFCTCET